MNMLPTVLMLMAIGLLTVQGIALFGQSRAKASSDPQTPSRQKTSSSPDQNPSSSRMHFLVAGLVNFILALLAFLAWLLFRSGSLILSPEYGILLAQGTSAWLWTWVTMIVVSVGTGMVLHAIRHTRGLADRRGWLIAGGIVIAVITALQKRTLNPTEPAAFQIRCIDMWSYFFLAWVVVALTLWFLTAIQPQEEPPKAVSLFHACTGSAISLTACGLVATYHASFGFAYADASTLVLWSATALAGVPTVMCLLTWHVSRLLGPFAGPQTKSDNANRHIIRKSLRIALSVIITFVGVVTALLWMPYFETEWPIESLQSIHATCLGIWCAWAVCLALAGLLRWHLLWRRMQPASSGFAVRIKSVAASITDFVSSSIPNIGNPNTRTDDFIALLCIFVMIGSIADISHSARMDPIWDLAALIISWLVLSEIIGRYPLCSFAEGAWRDLRNQDKTINRLARKLRHASYVAAVTPFQWLFGIGSKADSKADPGTELKTNSKIGPYVLRVLVVIIVLIAVAALPDRNKTIVQSFVSTEFPTKNADANAKSDSSKELGRLVSERVVNTIGLVGQEIRPDLLVLSKDNKLQLLSASGDVSADVQASLATSTVQIPGIGIPISIGLVTTLIQLPMRQLLGVRIIHGSVQKEGDHYTLLASSSTGQTWQVSDPREEVADQPCQAPASPSPIAKLGDTLAYQILTSDTNLRTLGISSSANAIPDFRAGVAQWNKLELSGYNDSSALSASIQCFRQAAEKDPQFALAYYRLGQAYLSDGQPRAAADAFRASIRANPAFVASYITLAEILNDIDRYYYPVPAAVSPLTRAGDSSESDQKEARDDLEQVISELKSNITVPWRAEAYLVLCADAFKSRSASSDLDNHYVAFFYCRRAEYLYSRLPSALRSDTGIKEKEATVLYNLGFILQDTKKRRDAKQETAISYGNSRVRLKWLCDPNADLAFSTYDHAAERYYGLAHDMRPDNSKVLCRYAEVKLAQGDANSMNDLATNEKAHLTLAQHFIDQVKYSQYPRRTSELYARALTELITAIDLAPYDPEALNSFAYGAWEWYWAWIRGESANRPSFAVLEFAATQARETKRLTEDKGSRASHGMYQSSLGESLLATGKFDEAVDELNEIFHPEGRTKPDVGEEAVFDEIRWDLAQAYMCATAEKGTDEERQAQAKTRLDKIGGHEDRREDQRFSGELAVDTLKENCRQFRTADVSLVGPWWLLGQSTEGVVYGITPTEGVNSCGSIFELVFSNGTWKYRDFYDFECGGGEIFRRQTLDSSPAPTPDDRMRAIL